MSAALASAPESYGLSRYNAVKHGVLSAHRVLPWEDAQEYDALVGALSDEHQPDGPTEEHLVAELAGVLWRKRRLRLAEAAALRRGLEQSLSAYHGTAAAALSHLAITKPTETAATALTASAEESREFLGLLEGAEVDAQSAIDVLDAGRPDAYDAALALLHEDVRRWWENALAGDSEADDEQEGEDDAEPYTADADGLGRFLAGKIHPWLAQRRAEVANRSTIRNQAFGEALEPKRLESLVRYEVHLDRKLERTLSMLLRLRELRVTARAA